MKKRDFFNKLFDNGISYEKYAEQSSSHVERMEDSWFASQAAVKGLSQDHIARLNEKLRVLCIAENWCGDCANAVPVIAKLANEISNWDFRIVSRDLFNNEVEMFYTTAGRKKIPVIIFADEDGDEIMRWIERPTRSYHLLGMLRDQNLPKEEFLEKYNNTPDFQPPTVSKEILGELIGVADKAASILRNHPPKRKRPTINTLVSRH
ncbi:MAG: thioredoxin family protein [Candidatus Heimdallarchaeota archaeon]|nr:MAG: thioredoxin family protein [Candidatus Heimdallarchaeota archaeon]